MKKKEWQILLSYIRAHIGVALFLAGSAAVFAVVLFLSGLPAEPVRYAALLCAVGGVVCALPGYLQYRRRYKAAELALQGLPEAVDRLRAPSGAVEEAYDAALRRLCAMLAKSETDRQRQRIENADYFTMWIHQIKTPIAAMQLILREQDDARSRELLAELFRIDQYAEMALTYARLESPTTDLVLRRCAVEPIVRSVVRQYAGQFVRRHVALRCEIEPVCALTDEKWLAFILGQLLSNAVKYTENGTVTVRVTKEPVLSVSDTGIGIAPEDLPRVFDHGYTGLNGRKDKRATGLGLYLSRRILDQLGHTISIASEPGRGTRVTIGLDSLRMRAE